MPIQKVSIRKFQKYLSKYFIYSGKNNHNFKHSKFKFTDNKEDTHVKECTHLSPQYITYVHTTVNYIIWAHAFSFFA